MPKLTDAAVIQYAGHLRKGKTFTLQFNLEVPRENVMGLIKSLTETQTHNQALPFDSNETPVLPNILESQITSVIQKIGVPAHIMGYRYLKDAIALSVVDDECVNAITKIIYPEVAAKNNTTPSRVERAIRHAIEVAWTRGNTNALDYLFGYSANPNVGRPTNSEFIALIADNIRTNYY